MIREYLARGGGLDRILTEQPMAYDAIRMCFLEISEAAIKLGALAELHEPDIPWSAIRAFGYCLFDSRRPPIAATSYRPPTATELPLRR